MQAYERGYAAALSILTEPFHFGGSLDDLREALGATDLPILRKDFIVDRYQLYESAAAGADAILLIVAALEPDDLTTCCARRDELDLDAIVEVHDERELEVALDVEADVLGLNNRDLNDFSVDIERTYELLSDVPAGKTVVAESGYPRPRPARRARARGRRRRPDRRDADARARHRGRLHRAHRRPRPLEVPQGLPGVHGSARGWAAVKNGFPAMVAAGLMGGGVATATLLGTGLAGRDATRTVYQQSALGSASSPMARRESALTVRDIYKRDAPGVVFVRARSLQSQPSPFDLQQRSENVATGSAFVIDAEGRLLTNAHVVAGATDIRVTFSDDKTVSARVLGKDEDTDLALLGVDPEGLDLRPLALGSSSSVQVGDPTVAIGNPFGLDRTLTTGVVSAKQRRITAPSGFSIDNVIQTDAAINPGNSGGPLLDSAGRVIGINSQIATAGSQGSVGIAFAVPIDTAKAIIPDLRAHHMVSHAYLGARGADTASLVALDEDGRAGVRVAGGRSGRPGRPGRHPRRRLGGGRRRDHGGRRPRRALDGRRRRPHLPPPPWRRLRDHAAARRQAADRAGPAHRAAGLGADRMITTPPEFVGWATLAAGAALVAAPGLTARPLGLDESSHAALRAIGAADLALVPGLLRGNPKWPWMTARAALNLAQAASMLALAPGPRRRRPCGPPRPCWRASRRSTAPRPSRCAVLRSNPRMDP